MLVMIPVALLTLVAGVAFAQMGWPGIGWGQMGPGMMGPGMMGGPGWTAPQTPLTDEKAKELAQQYADSYLKGFTVERVLPFVGMGMTMYQAELKGPNDESRILHINPWGNVMPFGGA
jgi:hypothetical protein